MRNSREKYGETTGANEATYSVAGCFSVREIGRQKGSLLAQETEPREISIGLELESGSAEIR